MLIIDAHLDLSMNALQGNRDLLSSAYTIRTQETGIPGKGQGTVAFPDMRQGRIALSFVTLFARSTGRPSPHSDFASPTQSYGIAQGQLAYYRALERMGYVRIITDNENLDGHINAWQTWGRSMTGHASDYDNAPPLGFVISMEGADPILYPTQLEAWVEGGLRLIGLTHYGPGRYAGGTGTEMGLTELGRPLLAEMERLGVILDLTHCSDQSFCGRHSNATTAWFSPVITTVGHWFRINASSVMNSCVRFLNGMGLSVLLSMRGCSIQAGLRVKLPTRRLR